MAGKDEHSAPIINYTIQNASFYDSDAQWLVFVSNWIK